VLQSAYRGNLFHRIDDLRITPTIEISRRVKFRSEVGHMERRLAWSRLGGGSELFEVESVWRLLGRMLRSLWTVRQLKFPKRVELSLWAIAVLLLPLPMARRAIYMGLSRSTKPLFFRLLAGA
jgi:hypothetical protein